MSKTFTSRPAVTQGRGRGRGTNAQNQARGRTTRSTTTVSRDIEVYFRLTFFSEIRAKRLF